MESSRALTLDRRSRENKNSIQPTAPPLPSSMFFIFISVIKTDDRGVAGNWIFFQKPK